MHMVIALFVGMLAADMTGNWTLRFEKNFSGQPATSECTVQQQGDKLTVTCDDGKAKLTGEMKDRRVTLEGTTGRNNEIVVHYKGVINQEGSFLKGAWQYTDPADKKEKTGAFSFEKH